MTITQHKNINEHCRRIFSDVIGIHDEECLALFEASCFWRTYRKNEIIVQLGQIPPELPFIVSGSSIGYYLDSVGRHVTDCIEGEYGDPLTVATSLDGFLKPSDIYIEALEPTETISVPVSVIMQGLATSPDAANAMIRLVEKWFNRHRKLAMWRGYTLPERYKAFCEEYPEASKRLTKTAIARCLDVDLSAVSKMLKKLKSE